MVVAFPLVLHNLPVVSCHCSHLHFAAQARSENAVLAAKVKELAFHVKELTFANASLQAEVEQYRKEAALPSFSHLALGRSADGSMDVDNTPDVFLRSGNGVSHRQSHNFSPVLVP